MSARTIPGTPAAVVASVALVLAGCSSDRSASGTTEGVFFGDSLTDAGTYGFRFTTMPGQTWAQHVAEDLGQPTGSNEAVRDAADVYVGIPAEPGPGHLNYAQGGARAAEPYSAVSDDPDGAPISADVQLDRFLDQHGSFSPSQVATVFVGTNDVAYNYDPMINQEMAESLRDNVPVSGDVMDAERDRVREAASDEADTVQRMLDNDAGQIVVFTLYDLAKAPWFETEASRDFVGELTVAYNDELQDVLPEDDRVQVLDTYSFIDDLVDNAGDHGFTHGANEDACAVPGAVVCGQDAWVSEVADQTHIFAASEHLTTRANELLAEHVTGFIDEKFGG